MNNIYNSLIIGLGGPRGDDAAGWVAVDRLADLPERGVRLLKTGDSLSLAAILCEASSPCAAIVDAAAPRGEPGTIRSFDRDEISIQRGSAWSTHGVGLIEAIELVEALGYTFKRLRLHTIEAKTVGHGSGLSPEVEAAIDRLVETIRADFAEAQPYA
jgi:hydrogenase maturation protease